MCRGGRHPRNKLVEHGSIDGGHQTGGTNVVARAARHSAFGRVEMAAGSLGDDAASLVERGIGEDCGDVLMGDAGFGKRFARQIEAPDGRVLVEIPENVGHLKSPSKVVRKRKAICLVQPEDLADKRPTARRRDHNKGLAAANQAPYVAPHVDLDAVNHGEEVRLLEAEGLDRRLKSLRQLEISPPPR